MTLNSLTLVEQNKTKDSTPLGQISFTAKWNQRHFNCLDALGKEKNHNSFKHFAKITPLSHALLTAHQVWNFTMFEFNLRYCPSCKPPSCVVLTAHSSDSPSLLPQLQTTKLCGAHSSFQWLSFKAHYAHSKFISIWNGALRDTHHSPGSQLTAMPGFYRIVMHIRSHYVQNSCQYEMRL